MIIPVRCFTCGRVIGSDFEKWAARSAQGEDSRAVFDDLGVDRFCCRRMILSHVPLLKDAAAYE